MHSNQLGPQAKTLPQPIYHSQELVGMACL